MLLQFKLQNKQTKQNKNKLIQPIQTDPTPEKPQTNPKPTSNQPGNQQSNQPNPTKPNTSNKESIRRTIVCFIIGQNSLFIIKADFHLSV